MAEVTKTIKDDVLNQSAQFQGYTGTLTATGDFILIDSAHFINASIVTSGLTTDEVKVYVGLQEDTTIFTQILDDDDTNPFDAADALREIQLNAFSIIKIEKTGAVDTVAVEVAMSR